MNQPRQNYSAWDIDSKAFPSSASIEDKIAFLLGYGILAPSQHNTQPWRFTIQQNILRIEADYEKVLVVGDPHNDGLFIGLGACAENIVQAAAAFGLQAQVAPDATGATVSFTDSADSHAAVESLDILAKRHSDKLLYDGEPLTDSELGELQSMHDGSIEYVVISDRASLDKIVELHRRATDIVTSDPNFVRELVGWLRPNGTNAEDGMPGFVSGLSAPKAAIGKKLLTLYPKLFKPMAKKDVELMASASAVVVWAVSDTSPEALFACGRHVERFWLRATELGLAMHPMHSICAVETLKTELATVCGLQGTPALVARLGHHPDSGARTPRRQATWT